jgi:hypothetical protein
LFLYTTILSTPSFSHLLNYSFFLSINYSINYSFSLHSNKLYPLIHKNSLSFQKIRERLLPNTIYPLKMALLLNTTLTIFQIKFPDLHNPLYIPSKTHYSNQLLTTCYNYFYFPHHPLLSNFIYS